MRFENVSVAIASIIALVVTGGWIVPASAATKTYNYSGEVTGVFANGTAIPPNASALNVGDAITGSYSYDDVVLSENNPNSYPLTNFSFNSKAGDQTLDNFLGVKVNGEVNVSTGNLEVGVNSPVFLPGGFSTEQDSFRYTLRQVNTVGTFKQVLATNSQPVPEPSSEVALFSIGITGLVIRYRQKYQERSSGNLN